MKATKLLYQFKSHQSYQINYKGHGIKLIENKKKNEKRNWSLLLVNKNKESKKGDLTLLSDVKETLSKGYTAFKLNYEEEVFYIKNPYMHKGNYCEIKDSKENIVATHMKQNLFSLKRNIQLEDHYSELQNGLSILTLSVIIFVA